MCELKNELENQSNISKQLESENKKLKLRNFIIENDLKMLMKNLKNDKF